MQRLCSRFPLVSSREPDKVHGSAVRAEVQAAGPALSRLPPPPASAATRGWRNNATLLSQGHADVLLTDCTTCSPLHAIRSSDIAFFHCRSERSSPLVRLRWLLRRLHLLLLLPPCLLVWLLLLRLPWVLRVPIRSSKVCHDVQVTAEQAGQHWGHAYVHSIIQGCSWCRESPDQHLECEALTTTLPHQASPGTGRCAQLVDRGRPPSAHSTACPLPFTCVPTYKGYTHASQ